VRDSYFAFGNIAIDDLVFSDGTTAWAVPGGGATYAALGMALWTGHAAVIAPLGADFPGDAFPALDFSLCRSVPRTKRNWGLYEVDGSRHFVSRTYSLPWDAFFTHARELDAGPFPFAHIGPMPLAHVAALIDALRARGAHTISLDVHDKELAAFGADAVLPMAERVDLFFPSRQDVAVLVPGASPLDALRTLRARLPNVPVIGVKADVDGVFVHARESDDIIAVPPAATAIVDPTGAGDAFCGGMLSGFAERGDVLAGALRGAVSASFALAAIGPQALTSATRPEAEARLETSRQRVTRRPLRTRR
jgi:sugar/nucleoside kinase (ribokinase family)